MARLVRALGALALAGFALAGFAQAPRGVEDPRAFVQQRYSQYLSGDVPATPLDGYAGERLVALVHALDEAEGGEETLGFDWWIDGQDWELADVRVTEIGDGPDRHIVVARFANFGRVSVNRFRFVRSGDRWLLDDVVNTGEGGGWTLSELLRTAAEAASRPRP